jgi:IS30 family transposase
LVTGLEAQWHASGKLENIKKLRVGVGFNRMLDRVETQKRLSITYDRSKEMPQRETLTSDTGVKVYFAAPRAPWQRGLNENANGLIRRICPKAKIAVSTSRNNSTDLPGCSTLDQESRSAGSALPNSSFLTSTS